MIKLNEYRLMMGLVSELRGLAYRLDGPDGDQHDAMLVRHAADFIDTELNKENAR